MPLPSPYLNGTKIDPLDVDLPSVNTTATLETTDLNFTVGTAKPFVVKAQNGNAKTYQVTVTVLLPKAEISTFDFDTNTGNIDQVKGEITFATSYDYATWKAKLTATKFVYSDNAILSFDPRMAKDYTIKSNRQITIIAEDNVARKTYKVKVQIEVTNNNRFDVVYGEIERMGGITTRRYSVDLNHLDVNKVTDMTKMFEGDWDGSSNRDLAFYFNGDISEWDVSNVTDMTEMFTYAREFNGDISEWKVDNVTNMSKMFYQANNFNGNISSGDISKWKVNKVTNMESMFSVAYRFNRDISLLKVHNVTNMFQMFGQVRQPSYFNQDLSAWNRRFVTNCKDFAKGATQFTHKKPSFAKCTP